MRLLAILGICLVPLAAAHAQKGHRVTSRSVVVNRAAHWSNWQLPTHAVQVSPDGTVEPHFFRARFNLLDDLQTFTRPIVDLRRRSNQNAILNIDSTQTRDIRGEVILDRKGNPIYSYFFRPGISRVGSNAADAANILDDDPTTFWEPEPQASLDDWWIEIDLGRVVAVDSLVIHFVEEELGDPFFQFRVLAAPDQEPVQENADKITFERIANTKAPNRDQRTFRIGLEQLKADPDWQGRLVQTIRIVVSDTRGARGEQISAEEWQALPANERGAIVYFIRDEQGFEEPVERAVYESLDPQRQGRLDYYRRERPRLAGIEVYGFGDNISSGLIAGGGQLGLTGDGFLPGPAFDGDFNTSFLHLVWSPTIDRGVLTVDMGASFWLDVMRISSARPRPFIDGYLIRGSDGSRDTRGKIKWARLSPRAREDNSTDRFEHIVDTYTSSPKLRFLEISIISADPRRRGGYNTGPTIVEYQLFSTGYPAQVELTSDLIALPGARNFGAITWEAETPPGTTVAIRTRTGDLLGKVIRYFDKTGNEITYDAWKNLLGSFKGPADTTFVPTSGWSPWSRAYQQPGDIVTSPGLRKFMQFQVGMITTDREAAASIRSLAVELLNPVAERIAAELWPASVEVSGVRETFDVFAQPYFIESPVASRSSGFNEILLTMPASENLELLEFGIGGPDDEQVFRLGTERGVLSADDQPQAALLANGGDSIWVRLDDALNILPATSRTYNRITREGEEVPVTQDGLPLTAAAYGTLDKDERGAIRYFRRNGDRLSEIDQTSYGDLPSEEQGPVRYFRILRGDGAQFSFDALGDSLDSAAYNRLSATNRGIVTGPGQRFRLRLSAPVFLNGTTLRLFVRHAASTDAEVAWQAVEAGNADEGVGSNTLAIKVPIDSGLLHGLAVGPNPFTPNGDGINDAAEISLDIFKLTSSRRLQVRIYTLDGRGVWQREEMVLSGRTTVRWDGVDDRGRRAPPGLYLCQVQLDADAVGQPTTQARIIAVAY